MTNPGNIGGHGQSASDPGLVPPGLMPPNRTDAPTTTGKVSSPTDVQSLQQALEAYFMDTITSGGSQVNGKQVVNYLNNIPPPNAQTSGTSGTSGSGNPFLAPNPLVAFFMTFQEIASVMRQNNNALAQLTLSIMSMIIEQGQAQAQQTLTAANAEASGDIAMAVSSFTEAGVAIVQAGVQAGMSKTASSELDSTEADLDSNVNKAQDDLTEAQNSLKTSQEKLDLQRANVETQTNQLAQLEQDGSSTVTQTKIVSDANQDLTSQHRQVMRNQDIVQNKQDALDQANQAKIKFKTTRQEQQQAAVQSLTFKVQMAGQFVSKAVDGAANIVKATAALQKGQADAYKELLASYIQNDNKTLDLLIGNRQANSQMVSDLFQQLRKFSDDERKLGGSIAVQSSS
jgi:hypothetical protein